MNKIKKHEYMKSKKDNQKDRRKRCMWCNSFYYGLLAIVTRSKVKLLPVKLCVCDVQTIDNVSSYVCTSIDECIYV